MKIKEDQKYFLTELIKNIEMMKSENKINFSANNDLNIFKNHHKSSSISQKFQGSLNKKFSSNLVLKNTEFLTNLQNYLFVLYPYVEAKIDYLHAAIDPNSLCKIIVQNMYLLQISYIFKLKLWLSMDYFVEKGRNIPTLQNVNVFQLYCFDKQFQEMSTESRVKCVILEKKFIRLFDQGSDSMQSFFFILEKLKKTCQLYFQSFQKGQKPQSSSNSQSQLNRNLLFQFVKIYRNTIQPSKNQIRQPKFLIKILQQTKLFRYHSTLVKIVNGSLFYSLKLNSVQIIKQLRTSIMQMKQYFKFDNHQPKYQRNVVKSIDNFFSNLCKQNVIEITKSLKGIHEQDQQNVKGFLSLFQYDENAQKAFPTIVASILVPQQKYLTVSLQMIQKILKNQSLINFQPDKEFSSPKSLEFQISYTFLKNEIKVKCITDIDVLVDNMDFLNYLMTVFNDELKSSIFIDTIEKFRKSINKRIQKVIAFKLTALLKPNQQPLTTILQLIDIGVLTAKIFTAQLSKKSYIKPQQYKKRQKICQIYRHYENIFRNVMKKFYSSIQVQSLN